MIAYACDASAVHPPANVTYCDQDEGYWVIDSSSGATVAFYVPPPAPAPAKPAILPARRRCLTLAARMTDARYYPVARRETQRTCSRVHRGKLKR